MKTLIVRFVLCLGLVGTAHAQFGGGGLVYVMNSVLPFIDAPVFDIDGVTRLEGPGYLAQLYAGPAGSSEAALTAAGSPRPFLTGSVRAGYFNPPPHTFDHLAEIPSVPGGGLATVQVRAWNAASGASWETACIRGQSAVFTVVTGGGAPGPFPPSPPALLIGLTSFSLAEVPDSDGDGICDSVDACIHSDMRATVIIGDCDSGVRNQLFPTGCTMADLIEATAEGAANHGAFVSAVAKLTNTWKKDGVISGSDKGRIQSCAARSNLP